jgi:prepilin-type N-terminal cleavage/methylation domain-containing protein
MKRPVRCGFTLIEILIVMGILMIIMALALPNYNSFTTAVACNNSASIMYSDIVAMRQRALSTSYDTGIVINETANTGTYRCWEYDPLTDTQRTTKTVELTRLFNRPISFRFPCG